MHLFNIYFPFIPARRYSIARYLLSSFVIRRLSVKSWFWKTAKHLITQTTPHDRPGTLFLCCQRPLRNSSGITPSRDPNAGVVGKIAFFSTGWYFSDTLPSTKICVHPPLWSASTTMRWRRTIRCHQQRWYISGICLHTYSSLQLYMYVTWVAESTPQADALSVCVIRTTVGQHFNWNRASRGSHGDSRALVDERSELVIFHLTSLF